MNLIVVLLILVNVGASIKGFKDLVFFNKYKFSVLNVLKGEKYRLFSSGFLHVDYLHLGFNMYALYLFSGTVLYYFSSLEYLLIYVASLGVGNLLSLKLHQKEPYYNAVGASGAVTGIVYASIVLFPNMELYLMFIPLPIKGYVFGVGYLLFSIYGMKKQLGNVGHSAHIGGAITGFVITLLLKPSIFSLYPIQIAFLAVPIIVLGVLQKRNIL